jgi:isocitrate dehydrogenase (NAD+)
MSSILMLKHIGEAYTADRVEQALWAVYREGKTLTRDLGGSATTQAFTDAVIAALPHV